MRTGSFDKATKVALAVTRVNMERKRIISYTGWCLSGNERSLIVKHRTEFWGCDRKHVTQCGHRLAQKMFDLQRPQLNEADTLGFRLKPFDSSAA